DGPSAGHQWDDGHVAHAGERFSELWRGSVGRQSPAEGGPQGVDRLLDQWLSLEIVQRVALPDPGPLAGPAVGSFDHDVVVEQAGEGGSIRLHGMGAALQDARDDLPRIE